jgi:hypothetical protein
MSAAGAWVIAHWWTALWLREPGLVVICALLAAQWVWYRLRGWRRRRREYARRIEEAAALAEDDKTFEEMVDLTSLEGGIGLKGPDGGKFTLKLKYFSRLGRPLSFDRFVVNWWTIDDTKIEHVDARTMVPRLLKSNDELELGCSLHGQHAKEIANAINKNGKQPPAKMAKYSGFLRLHGSVVVRDGQRLRVLTKEFIVRSAAITFWDW